MEDIATEKMADRFVMIWIKFPTDPEKSPQLKALRQLIAEPDKRITLIGRCGFPQNGTEGYVVSLGYNATADCLCRELSLPVEAAKGVDGLGFKLVKDDKVIGTVTSDTNFPPVGFSWYSKDLELTIQFTA